MGHLVDRLQDGYCDKSIIKDLKQEVVSNVFSEESKRKLKELDDIELNELGESVRTTQCLICLKHSTEGTIYCGCGWCLIPSQEHADILADPRYAVRRGKQGQRHGNEEWQ